MRPRGEKIKRDKRDKEDKGGKGNLGDNMAQYNYHGTNTNTMAPI